MADATDKFAERLLARVDAVGEARRATEATPQQRYATGASGSGAGYYDPLDKDYGYRPIGKRGARDIPARILDRARIDSVAAYRSNPMARGIIDTYVAFCVGDSGLALDVAADSVREVAESFWNDRRNNLTLGAELMFRDAMLNGEQLQQMMVGEFTGVCRRSPVDVTRVTGVDLLDGNPLAPATVYVRDYANAGVLGEPIPFSVIDLDDVTGLRTGEAFWWPMFKTLETDTRGQPLLMPIIDWLDAYDRVLSNLIDRTALARYIAWDVTVKGDDKDVEAYIAGRGGRQIPRSGTMEVHNDSVTMQPVTAQTGAYEDVTTNRAVLTTVAAGAGLAKTWLAEPEDANRATSLTMAEPVRRRIGSVQNQWLANLTEMVRFAVDRAVAVGRIDPFVEVPVAGGGSTLVAAADTITITGPSIAASDDQLAATVLLNVAQALDSMASAGVLSTEARQLAAQRAWEQFVGVPWRPELDGPDANPDDVATAIADAGGSVPLVAV